MKITHCSRRLPTRAFRFVVVISDFGTTEDVFFFLSRVSDDHSPDAYHGSYGSSGFTLNYAFYVCDEFSAPMIDSVSSYRPVDENLMGALL